MGSEASPRESVLAAELESCRRLCEELTTIIDSSYNGIYITDAEGRARIVNDAYFRITGLSRGDVFGKSLDELIERERPPMVSLPEYRAIFGDRIRA